jgi:cobalt/nickel transport system ATP-binding protein
MHHNPISISQLSYSYPDGTKALQKLDLEIKATEKVALVGANGSGKSTLLLHLNGVLLPQEGEIVVGENIVNRKNLQHIRNFVGLVFQNPDDQLFMPTVWQDVAFGPMNQGFRGQELSDRITQAMNSVGLDIEQYRNRQAHNLSGGEKKRVAIAGVLAMEPQVLAFDEPTAQLDPRSRRQLIQLLKSLPQTQLIATHDLDLALEISDRTVILNQGQIVYDGDTKTALSDSDLLEKYALELPLCLSHAKFLKDTSNADRLGKKLN